MRKLVMLGFAFALIGGSPVTAVLGLCADQPCCSPSQGAILQAPSCCNEVSCDERENDQAQTATQQITPPADTAVVGPPATVTLSLRAAAPADESIAVRPLSERLASLSTLLI